MTNNGTHCSTCSLSIMVARTDLPFMMQTIPHLVRICNFPFLQRTLFIDTAPLSGDKVLRPGIGTLEQLRESCQQLIANNVVDNTIDIDYSNATRDRLYQKHFGQKINQTHNYKGYPILGSIFALEEVPGEYILHFDSDILLYQESGYSWIEEAIKLLKACPEIIAIRPLGGPPFEDIRHDQSMPDQWDDRGFYTYKFFSSRTFLIDRQRFNHFLPLPVLWKPIRLKALLKFPRRTWFNYVTGRRKMDSWELMVSRKLEQTEFIRATMASPKAWTIHPKDRSPKFIQALPELIDKIEHGWYPSEQAGYYDFKSEYWLT